jgi:hypothetical protein
MSEAKQALISALEKSANDLEAIIGAHFPARMDSAGWQEVIKDPNWKAKWNLLFSVAILRGHAKSLRRDWPPFRPEEAQMHTEFLAQTRAQVVADFQDEAFRASILKALSPLLQVLEKYALNERGMWRFREEDCDPMPERA